LFRRKCARQRPDVTPVKPRLGRIATIRREGSEAVKDRASARMPPGAPAQTVQPVHAQTPGLDFQMVGQAHRPVELAAEPGDRLQPRLGRDLEPIEDRRQRQRDHSTGPASQLTTRPVQQRQIALASSARARGRWLDEHAPN